MRGGEGNWWVDEPIESLGSDQLDRLVFVERVQELIDHVGGSPASTVIGLVGPWGSGKTSTVNMIVEGLDTSRWLLAYVTPWALAGSEAVVSELLGGIATALPKDSGRTPKVREALKEYGAYVTPFLSAIPLVGEVAKGMGDAVVNRLQSDTVHAQMRKVAEELEKLARPILIIVDDIDRLQHEELLALFRAVRVLGRLPYVHYLLAYDEQTVLDVLEATEIARDDRTRALAFLEKIVSLRLDQPPTRPEQAGAMLASGLAEVISELVRPGLSESQRIRLDDEREGLLSAVLTEPRAISRYLTQLRTYLPIIGASEIDFVDFSVVTFLRLSYPALYQTLLQDKAALVGVAWSADGNQLERWGSTEHFKKLGVPDRHLTRVSSAVQRLFPLLASGGADSRRKGRRVSDPDYVDRYFALTMQTTEAPDVLLERALHEWATGRHGNDFAILRDLLNPSLSDRAACSQAARLIRRATSQSEDFTSTAATGVLTTLLGLLPLPPDHDIESAAINWIVTLLVKAERPDPAELLRLLDRPAEQVSPLQYLLRAINHLPRSSDDRTWFPDLVKQAGEAAWRRLDSHVRLGDDAPIEPIAFLLNWLETVWVPAVVRKRVGELVDAGLSLPDLAARMVEVSVDPAGQPTSLAAIDVDTFVLRLGPSRVLHHLDELRAAVTDAVDPADLSWSNRKAAAASQLLSAADKQQLIRLPKLPSIDRPPALLNHEPVLLAAPAGQEPDLKAQLTVIVPGGSTLPVADDNAPGLIGQEREEAALELLNYYTPATDWLSRSAPEWHLTTLEWQTSDAEARSSTNAVLHTDVEATGGGNLPVQVAAQVRTGVDQSATTPVLMLTIAVGFWLLELGNDRRPDNIRHNDQRPLPAALSPAELVDLLTAMLASTSTAFDAFETLLQQSPAPDRATVDLTLHTTGGMAGVVDLGGTRVVRQGSRTDHRVTIDLGRSTDLYPERLTGLAAAIVGEWLLGAGYRGYDELLLRIVQEQYD
ncbi:KAP family P-loop NTPase fold protein [Kribbella sp. NPDC002412]